ncbi:glutathione S-transferase omega-like 2 [Mrakia frigida]|uniref:glutathione S-transferase family protein n=1 Tax=Mrakia frigida TaxID=29902 RepID=UPI003FCBFF10
MASQDKDKNSDILKWASKDGEFKRQVSSFRDAIEEGGKFAPEKGRYHLYVSLACPWAHRALIVRKLKGLEDFIGVSVVHPHMLTKGWSFDKDFPNATGDTLGLGAEHVRDIYFQVEPNYDARFTVPIIYDTKEKTIVSNESSEIIRFLNTGFNSVLPPSASSAALDLYPKELQSEIDELNAWVYDTVNNGVYKSGFATTQAAYEKAVVPLFESLDKLEKILDGKDYLIGGRLTEADVRLYTTMIRFDPVYHGHFKCNLGLIRHDYPNINLWMKKLYWKNDAFKSTTDFAHIKEHYYYSHAQINPTRVVPLGPKENIEAL